MRTEGAAAPSSWDVVQIRNRLLNIPSGQDTWPPLREFLDGHDHIQAVRQLEAEEQAKLLEIIDEVSCYHPYPSEDDE